MRSQTYNLHQSLRHAGEPTLFKKIAKHFNCYGAIPHHNQPSVTRLFDAIANGELDIVNSNTGKGFWNEDGIYQGESTFKDLVREDSRCG